MSNITIIVHDRDYMIAVILHNGWIELNYQSRQILVEVCLWSIVIPPTRRGTKWSLVNPNSNPNSRDQTVPAFPPKKIKHKKMGPFGPRTKKQDSHSIGIGITYLFGCHNNHLNYFFILFRLQVLVCLICAKYSFASLRSSGVGCLGGISVLILVCFGAFIGGEDAKASHGER